MAASKRSAKGTRRVGGGSASDASGAKAGSKPGSKDLEIARLERLLALMHEHGLTELEIGPDPRSVRMSKIVAPVAIAGPAPAGAPVGAPAAAGGAAAPAAPKSSPAGEPFLSPMVGTFYRASSPEAKAFVMEGDTVKAESVLCIIEAMKVMNEIRAERPGKVVQILVENGEAVEYGQPLFVIQRT